MSIIRQQNPWLDWANSGNDIANTLARIMVTVPQLHNQMAQQQMENQLRQQQVEQQIAYQNGMLANDTAKVQPQIDHYKAQTEQANASAAYDTQRTATDKATMGSADEAGWAEFARVMTEGIPGFNPMVGGEVSASPENLATVFDAQRKAALMRNAGSSPTAAASMFRPTAVADGSAAVNPLGDITKKATSDPFMTVPATSRVVDATDPAKVLLDALQPPDTQGGITGPSALGALTGIDSQKFKDENPQLAANLTAWLTALSQKQLGSNAPVQAPPQIAPATNRFKIIQTGR